MKHTLLAIMVLVLTPMLCAQTPVTLPNGSSCVSLTSLSPFVSFGAICASDPTKDPSGHTQFYWQLGNGQWAIMPAGVAGVAGVDGKTGPAGPQGPPLVNQTCEYTLLAPSSVGGKNRIAFSNCQ